jgi:hypothetical protein
VTQRVLELLDRLYIAAEGAGLRDEDRKKAAELGPLLGEITRAVAASARARPLTLVDAAAGKGYVGLCAAELVLAPAGRTGRVVVIEREPARTAAVEAAAARVVAPGVVVEVCQGDVGDAALWPEEAGLVVALHACGPASDRVIDAVIATRARRLLLVPCCTGAGVAAEAGAERAADALGIVRAAPVRRAFVEAWVASQRTLRLEAAGWETEVVAFVPASVTPYNLCWRARRVAEPGRMARARADLERQTCYS